MTNFKTGQSNDGREMHYSVGILLKCKDKYFLMERKNPPPGFACPAGHIDEGEEEPKKAAQRELAEETGIITKNLEFVCEEEVPWNYCKNNAQVHYWYLFRLEVESEKATAEEAEAKSSGWYSVEEIKKMQLEEVWLYWFKKLKII